jgi:uncharacterized coiled-coil protein SlyX
MEPVQKQIIALSHKVDALYQLIDQLNCKVSESLGEIRQMSRQQEPDYFSSGTRLRAHGNTTPSLLDAVMEHKDILVDGKNELGSSHQNNENTLSADIQVQRLTAQLTAAYNRIAALEEQLVARRIHS